MKLPPLLSFALYLIEIASQIYAREGNLSSYKQYGNDYNNFEEWMYCDVGSFFSLKFQVKMSQKCHKVSALALLIRSMTMSVLRMLVYLNIRWGVGGGGKFD